MSGSPRVPEKLRPLFKNGLAEKLVELRENLHRHPELSFQEERTGALLHDELKSLDPANLERPCGRGLLLMRTFMDDVVFNDTGNEVTLIKQRVPRDSRIVVSEASEGGTL